MSAAMNSYNYLVKAPSVLQPVPVGEDEVVTFDLPPAVEYASHFRTIEELEEYYESLRYIPVQRPGENFIFTESADNYYFGDECCPFCTRFFPSEMTPLDRGRHAFKICPYRPVRCRATGQVMMAKDFLYLHMFTLTEPDLADAARTGVWAYTNAVKRDRDLRREAEERAARAEALLRQKQLEMEDMTRNTQRVYQDADVTIRGAQRYWQEAQSRFDVSTAGLEGMARSDRHAAAEATGRAAAAQQHAAGWQAAAEMAFRREQAMLRERDEQARWREQQAGMQRLQAERDGRPPAFMPHASRTGPPGRQFAEVEVPWATGPVAVAGWPGPAGRPSGREADPLQRDADRAFHSAYQRGLSANDALLEERAAREAAEARARGAELELQRYQHMLGLQSPRGALRPPDSPRATEVEYFHERTRPPPPPQLLPATPDLEARLAGVRLLESEFGWSPRQL